jgi:hypothetical protein
VSGCVVVLTVEGAPRGPSFADDHLVALLQTVATHLEERVGGSRFPLVWALAGALMEGTDAWLAEDLEPVAGELRTILAELPAVAARQTPTFEFGDEGYAEIYFAQSASLAGTARDRFGSLVERLLAVVAQAQSAGVMVRLERKGPRVAWWDRPS